MVRSFDKQTPWCDLDCDDINVISVRHSLCHVTEMIHIVQATSSTTPIYILSQKATPSTKKLTLFRDRDIERASAVVDVEQGANLPIRFLILNTLDQSGPIHPIRLPSL